MAGGPSQLETFDWKPKLKELDGQPFPESFTAGQQLAQLQNMVLKARGAFASFSKHGQAGIEVSDLFPHIGSVADDLCVMRSMQTEQINHDTAHAFMNTGSIIKGRPSMGSWLLYGLGAETQDLPGFIVLTSQGKYRPPTDLGAAVVERRAAEPFPRHPVSSARRRRALRRQSRGRLPEHAAAGHRRSAPHERPARRRARTILRSPRASRNTSWRSRCRRACPDLTDFKNEPQAMLDLYGVKEPGDGSFASNCLLARRLAERGVRMIQLYHRAWDHHDDLEGGMKSGAKDVDQATAALITDLKQRGMLDDTLILWGGEFGRTPMGQGTGAITTFGI
jgi:hypothetical protein